MFHPPKSTNDPADGVGHISNDGHMYLCKNPAKLQQAFHVIFVIDKSSSMGRGDRQPLPDAPATDRIRAKANNRLGAVYSALYSFWSARHAAVTSGQQASGARRDAYSIILFDKTTKNSVVNDFTSTPDQLLDIVLNDEASGGTDFTAALQAGQAIMIDNWSTERAPVMIFLSDGQSTVQENTVVDLCRSAIQQGKPLSFHAVSFGPNADSTSHPLSPFMNPYPANRSRILANRQNTSTTSSLRNMVNLALEAQNRAPPDPLLPAAARIPSSYNTALETVHLAETFLGFAESLRKPRGSLMR